MIIIAVVLSAFSSSYCQLRKTIFLYDSMINTFRDLYCHFMLLQQLIIEYYKTVLSTKIETAVARILSCFSTVASKCCAKVVIFISVSLAWGEI